MTLPGCSPRPCSSRDLSVSHACSSTIALFLSGGRSPPLHLQTQLYLVTRQQQQPLPSSLDGAFPSLSPSYSFPCIEAPRKSISSNVISWTLRRSSSSARCSHLLCPPHANCSLKVTRDPLLPLLGKSSTLA